jgi:hypothetical protein
MTPQQLISEQQRLGLNHKQMQALLHVCRATYYNWRNGRTRIPQLVADKLESESAEGVEK